MSNPKWCDVFDHSPDGAFAISLGAKKMPLGTYRTALDCDV
jgi:hypothetical protein